MFSKLFLDHPKAIGMSYGQHGAGAARIGFTMLGGGLLCLVHALIPGLFERTTSDIMEKLHETTKARRALQQQQDNRPSP